MLRHHPGKLALRSGTDHYLVHINIGGLLDRERNRAGDRIRRHRELVSGGGELGFHVRIGHAVGEVGTKLGEMIPRGALGRFAPSCLLGMTVARRIRHD